MTFWYRHGHFRNEEEARGAFELAYQQAMDGMGTSPHEWMGMTEAEYNQWRMNGKLPGGN